MNHFMARLIFCFFAEDTEIFPDQAPFTSTIEQMSTPDGSNTHEVIDEIFRAMNTSMEERETAKTSPAGPNCSHTSTVASSRTRRMCRISAGSRGPTFST